MKKETMLNSFGERWEAELVKRGMTNTQTLQLLRGFPAFARLDRSTVHRWTTRKSDRVPNRARIAFAILTRKKLVGRSEKTLANAWTKEITGIQEELQKTIRRIGKLRTRIRLFGL